MKNISSTKLFLLILYSIFSFALKAQTNVSGFISANTTWNLAGSPYIVVGNALVSQGVTLTINPGVIVKLDSACALQVDGQMIAIGTPANRITFTSNQSIPQAGDWAELHFSDYAVNAVFDNSGNYLSGCIMKYCDVLYGGSLSYGAIHIESSSPYFSRCNIRNSKTDGVFCNGSSCLIDSSAVDSCLGLGFMFSQVSLNSCGVTIQMDTIKNCGGGIEMQDIKDGCNISVKNNYFISTGSSATLLINGSSGTIGELTGNNFISNRSVVTYGVVWIYGSSFLISENLFINNITYNNNIQFSNQHLISVSGSSIISNNSFINNVNSTRGYIYSGILYIEGNSMISGNSFINDSIGLTETNTRAGIILIKGLIDTIECNLFLNNQISAFYSGCINVPGSYKLDINNNIFDGNFNAKSGASVALISANSSTNFANNTIRNNSAPLNSCCIFNPMLAVNNPSLRIEQNNFNNNISKNIISLSGYNTGNANYNFLSMKNNNFNDPAAQYELYNSIPYGSPNLFPGSNYWGSTSTLHIDSVIFDYFDSANLSVVYYQPILTAPVVIDTTCSGGNTNGIKILDEAINSNAFPNPFSNRTEVIFGKEMRDAEVRIYNVFGQMIRMMEYVNGDRVRIERGNLCSGVYIYDVLEKMGRVGNGKLVVE